MIKFCSFSCYVFCYLCRVVKACMMPFLRDSQFSQRFIQHFELLQKACLPDNVSYFSFRETTIHARFSVSTCYINRWVISLFFFFSFFFPHVVIHQLHYVQTISVYNCFKDAQRIAKELRDSFANDPDRIAELRRIEQVAEHNGIALNLICRLGTLDPSLKVSFEFTHHPYLAVAVVKRS